MNNLLSKIKTMENWKENTDNLTKTFNFKDFIQAVDFVVKIRDVAETFQHHPDLYIHSYNKVKVILTTHSEGRVTEKDYKLAEEIDKLF
ncbi:MAG: 4a-hydroxytetrahydrobiopterin dehydratase [Bacteroidales bacterium]